MDSLAADIRKLLFEEWDPAQVHRNDYMAGHYDDFIPTIYKLIVFGHPVEEIYAQLNFIEKGDLCLTPRKDWNLTIAQKLFALGVAKRGTGIARSVIRYSASPAVAFGYSG
ncbi:MAG: hypothetical protein D4S02_14755 [Rhodocyclaceae bacterium]|nr:MAG: hypothetical protein D4S02_14755 [Rhodocyclaceae bacterium]